MSAMGEKYKNEAARVGYSQGGQAVIKNWIRGGCEGNSNGSLSEVEGQEVPLGDKRGGKADSKG